MIYFEICYFGTTLTPALGWPNNFNYIFMGSDIIIILKRVRLEKVVWLFKVSGLARVFALGYLAHYTLTIIIINNKKIFFFKLH